MTPTRIKRHGGDAPALANHVHQVPLVVGDARRHLPLHPLHRQDLDPDIDHVRDIEGQVLVGPTR